YQPINNGVYRAGFATTQGAYEEGVTELFNALDHWENVLDKQRYL
ncbi:MAG TPA: glutathione-dependent reductase, partial [Cyanobacteria bacterium UBA12227]|nr:glutathione-dependent reductase [Cyanobacteria bacterium UBA12227]